MDSFKKTDNKKKNRNAKIITEKKRKDIKKKRKMRCRKIITEIKINWYK